MRYQIRGVRQPIERANFDGRLVDFWSPGVPTKHLLIAHDGQNVFKRDAFSGRRSWRMVQCAMRVSSEYGIVPPAIIAVFHSRTSENPWGRILDLAPQDPFQSGISAAGQGNNEISLEDLQGNRYLEQITEVITPAICGELGVNISTLDSRTMSAASSLTTISAASPARCRCPNSG